MRIRRHRDEKLARLQALTGTRRDDLLAVGRIVDDVLVAPNGQDLFADPYGASYVVAVVRGAVVRCADGQLCVAGDVVVTRPYERIRSLGAVALVGDPRDAGRLAQLLGRSPARPSAPRRSTHRSVRHDVTPPQVTEAAGKAMAALSPNASSHKPPSAAPCPGAARRAPAISHPPSGRSPGPVPPPGVPRRGPVHERVGGRGRPAGG